MLLLYKRDGVHQVLLIIQLLELSLELVYTELLLLMLSTDLAMLEEQIRSDEIVAAAAVPQKKPETFRAEILRWSKKKITPPHFRDGMIACMTPNNP